MQTNRHPKQMQTKSRSHAVETLGNGRFVVVSGESGRRYNVALLPDGGASCTCDWAKYRPAVNAGKCGCSHVIAVYQYQAQTDGAQSVSAWKSEEDAARQHRQTADIGDGLFITIRQS